MNTVSVDASFPKSGWGFAIAIGLLSRGVIAFAMLIIAPQLPAPPGGIQPSVGWEVFSWWDSQYYQQIAISGYEYANDGEQHNLAFFPLFPLLLAATMRLGISASVAGVLINNFAFLGALLVLYTWVEQQHDQKAARWATAVLAWCPLSLFGTVVYAEGLYLLLSGLALSSFERQRYGEVALWGALATATRPTGLALIPALAIASWQEKRPLKSYLASSLAAMGVSLFSLYCWLQFDDPLAFIHAQRGWRSSLGFDWQGWLKMLVQITAGTKNWKAGGIVEPWHPLLFALIALCGMGLWRFRPRLQRSLVDYGFFSLGVLLWLLAGDPLTNIVMVLGGAYLLWRLRSQLSSVTLSYGFCGLGLLIGSGGTTSLNRLAYGIISLSLALGILLRRFPRCGKGVIAFFAFLLMLFAIRFAQHLWVA